MINISPTAALELPIDELAMLILKDIIDGRVDNEFNYLYQYSDNMASPFRNIPGGSQEALYAIAEAVSWLRSHAMLAHKPGDSRADSILVTRWGVNATELGLEKVKAVERLQDNIHPLILNKARRQFLLGEYENAIFVSMKAVEIRVRKLAKLGDDMIGVDLMTKAFKAGGPLADKAAPAGEVQGMMMFFAGAYAVLRNPSGHRDVEFDDVTEASEAVITASLLMRILDKVEQRQK